MTGLSLLLALALGARARPPPGAELRHDDRGRVFWAAVDVEVRNDAEMPGPRYDPPSPR
jgi:hypothetical protein